jgi:uncharacterized protein
MGKSDKPSGSPGTTNRLANETSPYLLQHAHNPVDWYPWAEEALSRARGEDKPILLSIGYAACHWCHVMERESFEDPETAAVMNEHFVNIKVDREERPDLDDIYMKSVQIMTGHGGWPMTVFLMPDLKPFFGGTYFPPEDRHGMPSFRRVLAGVITAWESQREQITESSKELTQYLHMFDKAGEVGSLSYPLIETSVARLVEVSDREWGGLGGAPKFPQTASLRLAMRLAKINSSAADELKKETLEFIRRTLDRMAYGGMHDQIGGGFARYSVDRMWLVPHFEKMLYDNATLATTYLEGFILTGRPYWGKVATDTLDFVLRELTTDQGAFYCSLDADSEGEEGKFYVWRPEEVREVAGKDDGSWLCQVYGITDGGNFEHKTSVAHFVAAPEVLAEKYKMSIDDFWKKLEGINEKLLAAREKRIRPGRDEKVLTSWNGLMISAFARGYAVLQDVRYLDAARNASKFILSTMYKDGRLLRTWGKGKARLNGYLDDYSFLSEALLDLAEIDGDPLWFNTARDLTDKMVEHFWDASEGGFFYTSDDHEELLTRPKNYFDGSIPSGTSVGCSNLLRLARLTGNEEDRKKAETVLSLYSPHIEKAPDQFANLLCALDSYLSRPVEIAFVMKPDSPGWTNLLWKIHSVFLPNKVMLVKQTDREGLQSPLLESRSLLDGKPTAYICRNFACEKPINDINALSEKMHEVAEQR